MTILADPATAPCRRGTQARRSPAEPLLSVVGADLRSPLVGGESVRYANLDYAARAPALERVSAHVGQVLTTYSSVHREPATPRG